jgi:hypothetical protein
MKGAKMRRSVVVGMLGFAVASGLVGCASTVSRRSAAPIEVAQTAANVPFGLTVVDEVNDGERLHILASIESRAAWDPRRLMVRLTGLQGDAVLGVSDYPVAAAAGTALPETLPAGESFDISLSIPALGITDYQLELLWGEEAGPASTLVVASSLRLEDVTVSRGTAAHGGEACRGGDCPVVFEVTGTLTNQGPGTIFRASLGIGFLPHGGRGGPMIGIPADEEVVDLGGLAIVPGASRPVRLTVEQPSLASGDALTPVVRVVSFEAHEVAPGSVDAATNAG